MKIESKISGWRVDLEQEIHRINTTCDQIVSLLDIDKLENKTAAQWIFDNYNLVGLNAEIAGCNYGVIMSYDDIIKVSIMEYHPELEAELQENFGENWAKYYLRFGH